MPDELKTTQRPWRLLRDTTSTADADLAATTKTGATFISTYHPVSGSSGIAVKIAPTENKLLICFDFKNANTDTAVATIYLYSEAAGTGVTKVGPAEFACVTGTITAGAQQSDFTSTTRYFGDTIATITQRFVGGSSAISVVDGSGNDGVAKLRFDVVGYKYILCLFTTISANDNVRAWMRGY